MSNILEKVKVTVDKDLESAHQIVDKGFEKVKVTVDKDLETAHQIVDKGFEKVKVTVDKDFEKFMKTIAFFQR